MLVGVPRQRAPGEGRGANSDTRSLAEQRFCRRLWGRTQEPRWGWLLRSLVERWECAGDGGKH